MMQEIEQGRNKLYFRIDGMLMKIRRSELEMLIAKIVDDVQGKTAKIQHVLNTEVGTNWIKIY